MIMPGDSINSILPENNIDSILIEDNTDSIPFEELDRPYKDVNIYENESVFDWNWNYKTIYEQFTAITLNGKEYISRMRDVSESLLGDMIGSYEAVGYDSYTEQVYHRAFKVRQIQGVSNDLLIAVNMDGKYYVFMNYEYNPPAAFGELLDSYDLANTLKFDRFTMYEGYNEIGYYSLENDDSIWQTLTTCRNAQFVVDDNWDYKVGDKNYISFTATSEALGIYKKVF